jgi:hypothetical protein
VEVPDACRAEKWKFSNVTIAGNVGRRDKACIAVGDVIPEQAEDVIHLTVPSDMELFF